MLRVMLVFLFGVMMLNLSEGQVHPRSWSELTREQLKGKVKYIKVTCIDTTSDYRLYKDHYSEWWYDEDGKLTKHSDYPDPKNPDGRTRNVMNVYNDQGKLHEVWISYGRKNKSYKLQTSYEHDSAGLECNIVYENTSIVYSRTEFYNEKGQKIRFENILKGNRGHKQWWDYENDKLVSTLRKANPGGDPMSWEFYKEYEYDEFGRIILEQHYDNNDVLQDYTEFEYINGDDFNIILHIPIHKKSGKLKWPKHPTFLNVRRKRDSFGNVIWREIVNEDTGFIYLEENCLFEYYE